jgi:hypothetical protein
MLHSEHWKPEAGVLDIFNWPLPAVRDLKMPKCEILISWILMIFYHEVFIGRGL